MFKADVRSHSLRLVLLLLLALSAGAAGCDDSSGGDFSTSARPDIDVPISELTFGEVALGQHADQVFEVRNLGEAQLDITRMTITGADADAFMIFVAPEVPYADQPMVLAVLGETGDARDLLVRFSPQHVGGSTALLTIRSNDPDEQEVRIELSSLENGPRPQVVPNPVVFGLVDGGQVAHRDVRIVNAGSAPLSFQKIWLTGSRDFDVEVGSFDDIPFPEDALEPGKGFDLRILYHPEVVGPDSGVINIEYWFDDSTTRFYTADISANGAEPCIRITPQDAVDFGQSLIGASETMAITIENCGNEDLTVSSIGLTVDTDDAFSLTDLPAEISAGDPFVLVKDDFRQFRVAFAPTAEVAYLGELVILSDAPSRPEITRELRGIGTNNQCPTAVAGGRVKNTSDPYLDQFVAQRLQAIQLDGSSSSDPDGQPISRYEWSIAKAPDAFSQTFNNENAVNPEIQLTQVGDYVFELVVYDEHNRPSCNTARVEVRANSSQDVVIELSWRTPSDFDETDTCTTTGGCGTDLDLHMLPPGGQWNEVFGGDCFYANTRPAWGASGLDDDPFLDHDDVDGGGPETISIKAPARTDGSSSSGYSAPYQIGVYFYDDWGFAPPVFAQVRIFMDGTTTPSMVLPTNASNEMSLTSADPYFGGGHFWLVGNLDWTANGGAFSENTASSPMNGFPW